MGLFEGWHIFVLLLVVLVLFGSKKMPDAARSLGRSMRIFKAETQGLRDNETFSGDTQPRAQAAAPQPLPSPQPTVNTATSSTQAPETQPSNQSN